MARNSNTAGDALRARPRPVPSRPLHRGPGRPTRAAAGPEPYAHS